MLKLQSQPGIKVASLRTCLRYQCWIVDWWFHRESQI